MQMAESGLVNFRKQSIFMTQFIFSDCCRRQG